jgi:alkylhydroperoxidase/carboxymuconolactone decarboxylase family protein
MKNPDPLQAAIRRDWLRGPGRRTAAAFPVNSARSGSETMPGGKGGPMDSYYKAEHLAHFASIAEGNKELAEKFFAWYGAVFADGALSAREKALIALAVAHAVQCPYCIDAYTQESLKNGSDLEQMTEAVHVAAAIRGGASLVHGMQMLAHEKKASM